MQGRAGGSGGAWGDIGQYRQAAKARKASLLQWGGCRRESRERGESARAGGTVTAPAAACWGH